MGKIDDFENFEDEINPQKHRRRRSKPSGRRKAGVRPKKPRNPARRTVQAPAFAKAKNRNRPAVQESTFVSDIKAGGAEIIRLEGQYTDALYKEIARLYAASCALRDDKDAWLEFCRAEAWDDFHPRSRPKDDEQETDALRAVLRLAFGPDPELRDRPSKWRTALQPSFDKRVDPSAIPAHIAKCGGRDAMCRENRKGRDTSVPVVNDGSLMLKVPACNFTEKIDQLPAGHRIMLAVNLYRLEDGRLYCEAAGTMPFSRPKAHPRELERCRQRLQ